MLSNLSDSLIYFFKLQSDLDHTQNGSDTNPKSFSSGNNQTHLSHKPTVSNHRQGMRRSLSQKDLKSCDGYSVSRFLFKLIIDVVSMILGWKTMSYDFCTEDA